MKNEVNAIAEFAIEQLEERKEFTFYCIKPCQPSDGHHHGGGCDDGGDDEGEGGEGNG